MTLTEVAEGVIVRPMLTLDDAIDFACSGLAAKTRADYSRLLHRFAKDFPRNYDVAKITEDDFIHYFARRGHLSAGTRDWEERVLYSTFKKLVKARKIKTNPMEYVPRSRRPDPESLNLKRISTREVGLMLEATETWSERLCLAILVYMGPRRGAVARLRLRDYHEGCLLFHEKGGKTIRKVVPDELAGLISVAKSEDVFWPAPNDYLVPPEGGLVRKSGERDDRVIWRIVKRVAKRAEVDAHTHALRAAFAHFSLDSGKDSKALQEAMGHKNPATTERYTQRYDREQRMETYRGLSWAGVIADNKQAFDLAQPGGSRLGDSRLVGAGGFEPPEDESRGAKGPGSLRSLVNDLKPLKPSRNRS